MIACGVVKIALNCPHCPEGEPNADQEALSKHIGWDHELQHLLYGEDFGDKLKKKLDYELKHVLYGEDQMASNKDKSEGLIGQVLNRQIRSRMATYVEAPAELKLPQCQ